jgi:type IV secretory pathway TraG/TraD family ATPase VirD4
MGGACGGEMAEISLGLKYNPRNGRTGGPVGYADNRHIICFGDAANTFLGMSGATFGFTPNDPETAEWMSKRSGEVTEPGLSTSDDAKTGARESWRGEKQRVYSADDLYNIPPFHGLVFFAGQSRALPVFAAPYWDARNNPDLEI